MKKSSSARRVPRKIGQDDDDDDNTEQSNAKSSSLGSAVKRPSAKLRRPQSLRNAFGRATLDDDDDPDESSVVIPKRSQLSKVAVQRSATQRVSNLSAHLPLQSFDGTDDRPNYSPASLQELRDSTPSTPQNLAQQTSDSEKVDSPAGAQALDLAAKFGSSLAAYSQPTAIPSAAEIAEKKARRARLALEERADEYISLNPSDPELDDDDENTTRDEYGRLILKPKDKYGGAESRLVRDDEDVMENFDDFTEDGQVALGRKAELEAAARRKQEIAAQIAAAEGASDSDSDTSERERAAAFEAAQTKHGTYGQSAAQSDPYADMRPKTPPIISPLPTLDGILARLRKRQAEMQATYMRSLQEKEALDREKVRLAEEEVRIQKALHETAEKFAALRREKGIPTESAGGPALAGLIPAAASNGGASNKPPPAGRDSDVESEDAGDGRPALGLGASRRGLGSAGLGMAADQESDSDDY